MADSDIPLQQMLGHLQRLAERALSLWDLPNDSRVRQINVAENVTYLIEASGGYKSILRIHREGYHSRRAIECELAWLDALDQAGAVVTPGYYLGRNGDAIQQMGIEGLEGDRFLVLFHFIDGEAPDESGDMTAGFEQLGSFAARCHDQVIAWKKPANFERLTWDAEAVFGAAPTWGDWREGPQVDHTVREVLEQVEQTVQTRLAKFGKAPDRYNLIHADMRLANLLVNGAETRLIDFDDCGFGWFLYDFAAAISFIEDDPRIPNLKTAWLRGYRTVRNLSADEEAEMDTFIMLRRMALLAWIGSRSDAPEPQKLAPGFAATTARLGQLYLDKFGA